MKTVYGAVRDELGGELVAAKPIRRTGRRFALLPYGDRALLGGARPRDNNLGYELYGKTLDNKLGTLTPEATHERRRRQPRPDASFGPRGKSASLRR